MARYLMFPSGVMDVPDGGCGFTAGMDDDVEPVTVAGDATLTEGDCYPQFTPRLS